MDLYPTQLKHAAKKVDKAFTRVRVQDCLSPGKENVVADALSRKVFLGAISMPSNPILQEVKNISPMDSEYQRLKRIIEQGPSSEIERASIVNYSISNECLYYRYRLCVPKDSSLRRRILFEGHDSLSAGHRGYVRTLNAVRKSYFWPGMKRDVLNYVKSCLSCQRIKAKRLKMPGKLGHP